MDQTAKNQIALPLTTQQRIVAATLAALLGAFLIFGAGFSHSNTLHNAAHDGRHSFSFPCH